MFIQTESTPNPATLKFLPGREVMGAGAVADFPSAETAGRSPLAKALFDTPEVARVFFGSDFISVTKRDGDWKHLKPAIAGHHHGAFHPRPAADGRRGGGSRRRLRAKAIPKSSSRSRN